MRILTFGALIVVVGTFAALPFRRHRPNQQNLPTEATGPTQSTLSGLDFEMLVDDKAAEAEFPSLALRAGKWETRDREIHMPLTYDDLAVPLTLPPSFKDNFSATTTAQSVPQANASPQPGSTRPEPVMATNTISIAPSAVGPRFELNVEDRKASGRASTAAGLVSTPVVQPLPQPQPAAAKKRHWVRQP